MPGYGRSSSVSNLAELLAQQAGLHWMPVVVQPPRDLLHQGAQPVHLLLQGAQPIELFGRVLRAPPSDERIARTISFSSASLKTYPRPRPSKP